MFFWITASTKSGVQNPILHLVTFSINVFLKLFLSALCETELIILHNSVSIINLLSTLSEQHKLRQSTRLLTELSQERSNRGSQKMSLSTVCWWRRGSTPRPRGLCSLRADFAIRSRIAPSLVLSPKAGLFGDRFSRTRRLSTVVPKIVLWRRSVKIGDTRITMPTSDSEYFLCKTALRFYEP